MISLILPYWDRQAAANKAIALLAKHYKGLDLEVVVVDDGTPEPFEIPEEIPRNLLCLRMPEKTEPMSPVTAWNVGVEESSGDIVVISCIEVLHQNPVLEQMATALEALGPDGYVLAAAWCPENAEWHCHSSIHFPECPKGTGPSFLAAMHRSLYEKVGGFNEEMREGAGYEDRDFIFRLLEAGAKFQIRDDLVVWHPKGGAKIKWPAEKFARNEEIYRLRWLC